MKRYPHFLRAVKGGVFPSRIVALSIDSADYAEDASSSTIRERLAGWFTAGSVLSAGTAVRSFERQGIELGSLWEMVDWSLRQSGCTWVVSHCAAKVWSLAGVWSEVESGRLDLIGRDDTDEQSKTDSVQMPGMSGKAGPVGDRSEPTALRSVSGLLGVGSTGDRERIPDNRGTARRSGIAVLADPPSILDCRRQGLPGRLRIVDVRNFGIGRYPAALPGLHRARWLLSAIARMIRVIQENGWGGLQATAGGQSFHTFRRSYLKGAILCHVHPQATAIESAAYIGGRCECRRIGKVAGPIYHLDFRSLYPSVCRSAKLPTMLDRVTDGPPDEETLSAGSPALLIGDVQVCSGEPAYPYRKGGVVVYPGGTWRTCLCGPELLDAHQRGRITHWFAHASYVGEPALSDYMSDVYTQLSKARAAKDDELSDWLKSMLVCLPGKFGQRGSYWVPEPTVFPRRPWCQWVHCSPGKQPVRYRSLGWQCQREERTEWAPDASPAIAAWVTSAGRVKLLQSIRCAGWEETYYHDTDSLFVSSVGYDRLCDGGHVAPDTLGMLRLLGTYQNAEFRGIKNYTVDGRSVCSGLPLGAAVESTAEGGYWMRDPIADAVRRGSRPVAMRRFRHLTRAGAYRHGVVVDDGTVEPFHVEE